MGQEEETAKRLEAFAGYQITNELLKRGGANEVDDKVFCGPRSLVFQHGEYRL